MSDSVAAGPPASGDTLKRWLGGLRRGWISSEALVRWTTDRGITGIVHTPAAYEIDDAGPTLAKLVEAGARADKALLWDLAAEDVKDAADALRSVYSETEAADGYVVVWLDAGRATTADKAVAAAAQIVADIRRANVAVGMVWTSERASTLEALVANDCPVALSAVRDDAAAAAVASAKERGMQRRRDDAAKQDPPPDVPDVPVFLLAASTSAAGLTAVEVVTEFDLFAARPGSARLPVSVEAETSGENIAIDRLAQRVKRPASDDAFTPEPFARAVVGECKELRDDEVFDDMWSRDHTLWKDDPTEIADRLGWLDLADRMTAETKELNEFARKMRSGGDLRHIVLLGMGGSVLAAETFHSCLAGGIPLVVLDTTHPDHIASVTSSLDLDRTLFVVGSKSGTTIETRAQLEYFWSLAPSGERFVAITDPGTELASIGRERSFVRVFENPPDVGGRYSALSYFGLVPAAVAGVDIEPVLTGARRAMVNNGPGADPCTAGGATLAAAIGEAVRHLGRDKLTLVLPPRLAPLGDWIEQLVAESTGKEGKGVLPVVGEELGLPEVYGDDRLFCAYVLGDDAPPPQLEALEEHGIIRISVSDPRAIGHEMYRWEIATALLGYILDINPFDQPDVESAKRRAREALEGAGNAAPEPGDLPAALDGVEDRGYIAIQAFVPPTSESAQRLQSIRVALRDRYKVATTVGFGPRFLHSTGQLHKGGPPGGVFIQVTAPRDGPDIDVPGMGFSFGRLIDAQADGDLSALRDAGRAAVRVSLASLQETAGI